MSRGPRISVKGTKPYYSSLPGRLLQKTTKRFNHQLSEIKSTYIKSNRLITLALPGLQSTDGVNFCDVDNCSKGLESSTAALSYLQNTGKAKLLGLIRHDHWGQTRF